MFKSKLIILLLSISISSFCNENKMDPNHLANLGCLESISRLISHYHIATIQASKMMYKAMKDSYIHQLSKDTKSKFENNNRILNRGYFCNKFKAIKDQTKKEIEISNYSISNSRVQKNTQSIKYLKECNKDYFNICVREAIYTLKKCNKIKYDTNEWIECINQKSLTDDHYLSIARKYFPTLDASFENQEIIQNAIQEALIKKITNDQNPE